MKMLVAAFAIAIASPSLAQSTDPHAGHKAGSAAPAAPAHGEHEQSKKGCCAHKEKDCCKDMQGKSCCADKAKGGASHADHQGH